jgi:soluble lytic murein transglycosylase
LAPELEDDAVADLDANGWIERADAWSNAGYPSRAAGELRRQRFAGDDERRRILDLARHEVAAGNPSRGMRALRGLSSSDPEVRVVRAAAARRQAWQRYPRATARSSFLTCFESATSVVDSDSAGVGVRRKALQLVVECGTEVGRPQDAVAAWWRLEGLGWADRRRTWLGRRLAIALVRETGDRNEVLHLASAMPSQERCLRYWAAVGSGDREADLLALTDVGFPDLYSRWALEILDQPYPRQVDLAPAVVPSPPPGPVAWLVDRGALGEAAAEWRRTRYRRGAWPADGLAEAELAEMRGRRMDAIRALRAAIPHLGTVAMERAPSNGVRAYLPLEWVGVVRSAASESGVEPWLVAGVARQESAFVAYARSPRSAKGVMQMLEGTARGHARALGLGRNPDLMDPAVNIRLGARELKRLLDRFGATEPALAAYNAGETRVRKWWAKTPDRYRFTESIPIPETYNYVRRVMFLAEAYRLVYREQWEEP